VCTSPNTCFLLGPRESITQTVSGSLQPFCTAHGRVSSGMPRHVLSHKNCTFAWAYLETHLMHGSLGPPNSQLKQHLYWFSRFCTANHSVPIPYNLPPLLPSKLPFPVGGSGPHLTRFWVHPNPQPKRHLDRLSCFCRAH